MIGDGPLASRCRALIGELGLGERVRLLGIHGSDSVAKLMSQASLFVQHSVTAENGDKIHYHYTGKGMAKDGQFTSGSNKWTMMGGTGKFAALKGEGTCMGKGDGAGGATWDCTGTYAMK